MTTNVCHLEGVGTITDVEGHGCASDRRNPSMVALHGRQEYLRRLIDVCRTCVRCLRVVGELGLPSSVAAVRLASIARTLLDDGGKINFTHVEDSRL